MNLRLVVVFLATNAAAASRYEVINMGDSVEIKQLLDLPAPKPAAPAAPESYFSDAPPLVLISTWTSADLVDAWITAVRQSDRARVLERLSAVKPRSQEDLRRLLDLYGRDIPAARAAVEASLGRLGPADTALAPFIEAALQYDDPVFLTFGLAGAARMHTPKMMELVRALAGKPLPVRDPTLDVSADVAQRWFVGYAALRAVTDWDGAKALPLLYQRAQEAPAVAALAAQRFWPEAFDRLVAWSDSGRAGEQAMASKAWAADVPRERLEPTKARLWEIVVGKAHPPETRHRAALKLGVCAAPADVDRLLAEGAKADPALKPLLDAALFASRSPKAVPVLTEYVKASSDPISRAGALYQLREMLPAAEYRALLEWVAAHDADAENRANAAAELKGR